MTETIQPHEPLANTSPEAAGVLTAALKLSSADRAMVAQSLLATLDGSEDDSADVEAAWREEIERRYRQIQDGTAQLIDGDEVMREARRLVMR